MVELPVLKVVPRGGRLLRLLQQPIVVDGDALERARQLSGHLGLHEGGGHLRQARPVVRRGAGGRGVGAADDLGPGGGVGAAGGGGGEGALLGETLNLEIFLPTVLGVGGGLAAAVGWAGLASDAGLRGVGVVEALRLGCEGGFLEERTNGLTKSKATLRIVQVETKTYKDSRNLRQEGLFAAQL